MDNWTEYSLGELLSYEQPTAYLVKSTDYNNKNKIPVLTAGKTFILGYTNENHGVYDTLPAIIFDDFTTASQYVNFKFKVKSSAMKILTANIKLVVPKFIFYRMQIIKFDASTHKRYWIQQYSKIKVKIPPIPEQERIVARIEELFSRLDNSVNELKKAKERLKVYRQAVYASIYKDLSDMHPITEFFEISSGLTKNSKRNDMPIKMPYLRVANVYYDYLDLTEIKDIGVSEREIEPCRLKPNDLLFVEGNGSKSQIGRVAIWDGSIPNCLHQNHLIKGRPLGNMLSRYALYYLISRDGRKQIVDVAKSTSGLYTLSINKVKDLIIPYCDLAQQQQLLATIEEHLSICISIEKNVDVALQQAEALRQSILKKAFEGGL
ncbi:MAG: hypothetical protein HFE61_07380 [Anaerotignum sp.]|jgi:restriction endonuclease S subunit|nr:hypothetical protein [Anaerotignum sp.]